jgi:hypothetical protein
MNKKQNFQYNQYANLEDYLKDELKYRLKQGIKNLYLISNKEMTSVFLTIVKKFKKEYEFMFKNDCIMSISDIEGCKKPIDIIFYGYKHNDSTLLQLSVKLSDLWILEPTIC